jgi:hypothetical protein
MLTGKSLYRDIERRRALKRCIRSFRNFPDTSPDNLGMLGVRTPPAASLPMPDQLTVLVNRLDPMQRNTMRLPFMIDQFENTGAVLWKADFAKRHADDFVPNPVVITDDEFAAAEFRVPADAMKKVLNGDHEGITGLQRF